MRLSRCQRIVAVGQQLLNDPRKQQRTRGWERKLAAGGVGCHRSVVIGNGDESGGAAAARSVDVEEFVAGEQDSGEGGYFLVRAEVRGEERGQSLLFEVGRGSLEQRLVNVKVLRDWSSAALLVTLRGPACSWKNQVVDEEYKACRRDGGCVTCGPVLTRWDRRVEQGEERVTPLALHHQESARGVRFVDRVEWVVLRERPGVLGGRNRCTSPLVVSRLLNTVSRLSRSSSAVRRRRVKCDSQRLSGSLWLGTAEAR